MKLRALFAVLFAVSLGLWTLKLLEPNPLPPAIKDLVSWSEWLVFGLAKALHVGAYAYCTVVGRLAVVSPRWKFGVVLLMLLHGVGTEIGQTYVPNRAGSVRDVLFDAVGVFVGLAFSIRVLKS